MRERRGKQPPIPKDWRKYLKEEQKISLPMYENFGYTLYFIRRPIFHVPVVVMRHDIEGVILLNDDGSIEPFEGERE